MTQTELLLNTPAPQSFYDYKKFAILYVDDEEKSLKYFTRAFEDQFRIFTAASAAEGLQVLEEHRNEIGILMTDQRMPGQKGVWLLEQARQLRPRIIRILVTAYSDMDAAISAVNSGAIYKYISKPWDPPQLEATLKRGLEFFMVQRERDQLLRERLSVLHNMIVADRVVSLGLLAAGLSHHIRNSLVAVKTFLDLAPAKLQEEKVDFGTMRNPEFWRDYYQSVQAQIERINKMLQDLWSAGEPPSFNFNDSVTLRPIVASAAAKLQAQLEQRRIEVVNDIPEALPPLRVERGKFGRLFELLLHDELVSLPEGARITFAARAEPADAVEKKTITVTVQDNGPGLPEESLRIIFDPFALRSDTPMEYGINLMACFFIVHHHGGRIEASSEPGRGTRFVIRLPLDPDQSLQTEEDPEFLQKVLFNEQVLNRLIAAG